MLRHSFLIAGGALTLAGMGHAQQGSQSRDDLLDALTRHIQICSDIADTQQRLSCFDRLQTQVGGVTPSAQPAPRQPTPTPLQASQPAPVPLAPPPAAPTTGTSISSAPLSPQPLSPQPLAPEPLTPQPLAVPGGGVASLGGPAPTPSSMQDPNAAFDPRTAAYRPPEALGPKPQPQIRRTGPRPIPYASTPQPLVSIGANNLTYSPSRYWQVTVVLTSNTPRAVNTQAECTFMNGSRPVSSDYLGPLFIQPGEQITSELIGPPTTAYVDSTNCRLLSP